MDTNTKIVKDSNIESNCEDAANFKKYVIQNNILIYNSDNLIDKDNNEDFIFYMCYLFEYIEKSKIILR